MKKAIALIDVLVALIIITIIGIFIGKYVIGIVELSKEIGLSSRFEEISTQIQSSLKNISNIKYSLITPRGVFALDTDSFDVGGGEDSLSDFYSDGGSDVLYFNFEKAAYGCYPTDTSTGNCNNIDENDPYAEKVSTANKDLFSSIYNFTLYDFKKNDTDINRLKKQEAFWQIPVGITMKYGDVPLLFVMQRYGTYDGYRYPYKIFTLIDLGPDLFRRLKLYLSQNGGTDEAVKVMAFLFPVTDNGVVFRNVIHFDQIKQNDSTLYEELKKILGNNPASTFAEDKKYIKVRVFNTMPYVQKILANTISQMETIKHNVEDWAVIQARIAAYDSVNGNSMDKDYFITCTGSGCDDGQNTVDKTRTLLSSLSDDAKICNSHISSCGSDQVDETEISNGFFVCHNPQTGSSSVFFKGYYCSSEYPSVISEDKCIDDIKIQGIQGENSEITVKGAVRLDVPTNDGVCLLGEAARRLLSSTEFTENYFNIPLYFTNTEEVEIDNNIPDLLNSSSGNGNYVIQLNIPITGKINNPPYNAGLFTIMPWFLGGYEKMGIPYADTYESQISSGTGGTEGFSGYGIIYMPLFAHIF